MMKGFPQNYLIAVGARWGACLLVLLVLWRTNALSQFRSDGRPLLLFGCILAYTLLWTIMAPRFWAAARDGSIVILYDLFLSALPVWFSGGWASPFVPFALSALVVPALGPGWRLGITAAAVFLSLDQLILWSTAPNPWQLVQSGQGLAVAIRMLLPFGIVALVSGGAELERWYRWRTHERVQRVNETQKLDYRSAQPGSSTERAPTEAAFVRTEPAGSQPESTWKQRTGQPMLARRSLASIEAVLRHLQPELEAAGVHLTVQIHGDERHVPKQIRDLLIKTIEVALDNVMIHAHASAAKVTVHITRKTLHLQIVDDGIGLFDGTAEPPGFRQLKRLRYRVHELDGELRIEERTEGGVMLWLSVPVTE